MRTCPYCAKTYGDDAPVCPEDGAELVAADPTVGSLVAGAYRVEARIGAGGMGTVYRATQLSLDRAVALKLIGGHAFGSAAALERFTREARAIARLRHPHIVTVHDFGVDPLAGAYLAMELLSGRTLRRAIADGAPRAALLAAMRQVCDAVDAAHAGGVVHRDLKPDNVMLEPAGSGYRATVLDFGVARLLDPDASSLTSADAVVGTPAYMAPEQCEGLAVDERTDVYALGCILYEIVTGRPPFAAAGLVALLAKHVSEPPVPPGRIAPDVDPGLEAAILCALAKRPADRFRTAADLGRALERASAGGAAPDPAAVVTAEPVAAEPREGESRLPAPISAFVGREAELEDVARLLATTRLVTLTGAGGVGKTRLAYEAARRGAHRFRAGARAVALAPVVDPTAVAAAAAAALGVRERPASSPAEAVVEWLGGRELLLVVDNCEHVLGTSADLVAEILRACPRVSVLATSRALLGVAGEIVWRVPGLTTPGADAGEDAEALGRYTAVELFRRRAAEADPRFALGPDNARPVAALCAMLEGMPLAIELAAARTRVLSVEQILARMHDRFRLLGGGPRTAEPRQRTLLGAVEWSYNLLSEAERALLARLSVFAGGFSLEAAEAVAGEDVLDLLAGLADKSLVVAETGGERARYRMLETIREYAARKLDESGASDGARVRHLEWAIALAESFAATVRTSAEGEGLAAVALEHDNLRAAMRTAAAVEGDADPLLRLCGALGRFWYVRGHWTEAADWLRTALGRAGRSTPLARARAARYAAVIAKHRGEFDRAEALLDEAAALVDPVADEAVERAMLDFERGSLLRFRGERERSGEWTRRSLDGFRRAGDAAGVAIAEVDLGLLAVEQGAFERADRHLVAGLGAARANGDTRTVATALHNLGLSAHLQKRLGDALGYAEESLAVSALLGDGALLAGAHANVGFISAEMGDADGADAHFREALRLGQKLGESAFVLNAIDGFADVALARGLDERAMTLAAAADAHRERVGRPLSPAARRHQDAAIAEIAARTGEERAAAALARGRRMGLDEMLVYALER